MWGEAKGAQRGHPGVHRRASSTLLNRGKLATSANSETHPAQMFPGFMLSVNRVILTELLLKSRPQNNLCHAVLGFSLFLLMATSGRS